MFCFWWLENKALAYAFVEVVHVYRLTLSINEGTNVSLLLVFIAYIMPMVVLGSC